MVYLRPLAALIVFWLTGLTGCTLPADHIGDDDMAGKLSNVDSEKPARPMIDWASALDCRGKLELLQQGLIGGQVETLDTTPFALISDHLFSAWSGHGQLPWQKRAPDPSISVPGSAASMEARDDHAKRCVMRLGKVREIKAEHRMVGRERVRSSYQSGSRMEKNPAYEAAQARLRQAERANKPGKSSVITVGDPLLDLIGLVVGGAITGITQWSEGDPVEEAIENLMATPRSIERPTYRPYQFERTRFRASREAVLPVIMTDRHLQKSWRVSLKRREVREIAVLDGLDRQDRDYAQHRENGMTDQEFRQWQAGAPELLLEDMVAGLLGARSSTSVDRIASLERAGTAMAAVGDEAFAEDVFDEGTALDAAALPASVETRADDRVMPRATGHFIAAGLPVGPVSIVDVIGGEDQGKGVYVAPDYVLAGSELIEGRGLIDIDDGSGRTVLGLVAAVDRSRGLALVQVPRPGTPAILGSMRLRSTTGSDGPAYHRHRQSDVAKGSAPILEGRQLIGFRSDRGPDISISEIKTFLHEQETFLLSRRSPPIQRSAHQ